MMRKTAFAIAGVMTAVCAGLLAQPMQVNAQSIVHVGGYDSLGYVSGVIAQGNYAYVSDNLLDLVIMDISDPASPTVTGRFDTWLWIFDMDIYGDTVYVAAGLSEPYMGALYIVDVVDKANPYLLGSISFPWEVTAVEVSINPDNNQDYAYIVSYDGNKIIDVSNPNIPVELIEFTMPGFPADMVRQGSYLYAAAYYQGLQILDVSNVANPQWVGGCDTPGDALGVALRHNLSNYAFIADGDSGLQVIQISNPANPLLVGHLQTSDKLTDIVADGYFIYAALEDSGIAVIRAGASENPTIYAATGVPYRVSGIALGDGVIIVAGGESIDIYRLDQVGCDYVPGDINGNGAPNGIDVTYAVSYFKGGAPPPIDCNPPCSEVPDPFYAAGDVNGDCVFNGIDITFFVAYARGLQLDLRYCPLCPPNG